MADSSGRPDTAVEPNERGRRRTKPSVLEELYRTPGRFSFLQAVRLLSQAYGLGGMRKGAEFMREQLRMRPYLSLGFPPTDLVEIKDITPESEKEPMRRFEITASFLGLYGPSSPLPTFYTEELLAEWNEDKSVSRDFLDILNHGFFVLFALADAHYNLSRQICEEENSEVLMRLYSLVGLGHREMMDSSFIKPGALLRAAGLLTQFPRSAAGLRGLLADRIGAPVQVGQCEPRTASIPDDQRCSLGRQANTLGLDCRLGSEAGDAMGKISIIIGPVEAETFSRFLPGLAEHDELLMLVRFYCTQPLEFDLEFVLSPGEAGPGRLGESRWSTLGCDVWLSTEPLSRARAVFPERRRIWDDHKQRSIVL